MSAARTMTHAASCIVRRFLRYAVAILVVSVSGIVPIASSGQSESDPRALQVQQVAFSIDDGYLAVAGSHQESDGRVVLWNVSDWSIAADYRDESGFLGVVFDPDGEHLVVSGYDPQTRLIDFATNRVIRRFQGHSERVRRAVFAPNDGQLMTASDDRTVKIWSATMGTEEITLEGSQGAAYDVAIDPIGRTIAVADADGREIIIFDRATAKSIRKIAGFGSLISDIEFSPSGDRLAAACSDGELRVFNTATWELDHQIGDMGGINAIDYAPDGRSMVVSASSPIVYLYSTMVIPDESLEAEIRSLIRKFEDEDYETRLGARSKLIEIGVTARTQLLIATEHQDPEVRWQARRLLHYFNRSVSAIPFVGHDEEVISVSFSHDGKLIASGDREGVVIVWDVANRRAVRRLSLND